MVILFVYITKKFYYASVQGIPSDQHGEPDYDLNTPQMHANLHSEFLQSVSNDINPSKTNTTNRVKTGRNRTMATNTSCAKKFSTVNDKVATEKTENLTTRKKISAKEPVGSRASMTCLLYTSDAADE